MIIEESVVESALESANYISESADSNTDSVKISVWVRAFSVLMSK